MSRFRLTFTVDLTGEHEVAEWMALRCGVCGRESTTEFASSLRHGWERCCGYTMTLVRTDADIEAATRHVLASQLPAHLIHD